MASTPAQRYSTLIHACHVYSQEDDFFLWKVENIKKRRNLRSKGERKKIDRLA